MGSKIQKAKDNQRLPVFDNFCPRTIFTLVSAHVVFRIDIQASKIKRALPGILAKSSAPLSPLTSHLSPLIKKVPHIIVGIILQIPAQKILEHPLRFDKVFAQHLKFGQSVQAEFHKGV